MEIIFLAYLPIGFLSYAAPPRPDAPPCANSLRLGCGMSRFGLALSFPMVARRRQV